MADDNKFKFELFGLRYHTTGINKKWNRLIFFPLFALLAGGVYAGFALLVQFLWNISIAPMFYIKEVSWWQTLCLVLLTKLLFGKFEKPKKEELS